MLVGMVELYENYVNWMSGHQSIFKNNVWLSTLNVCPPLYTVLVCALSVK